MSTSNDKAVEQSAAKKLITESARSYLTAKLTLPLGNPNLKKLHTNMFLFTALPKEFTLKNWEVIGNALNSGDVRYADYQINRWYVEAITIDVEAQGKAEMQVDLNAFPSATTDFAEGRQSFEKAYKDATTQTTTNKTSSTKKTSNAIKTGSVLNQNNIKKYDIPKVIWQKASQLCNVNDSTKQKVKNVFNWMDKNVNYDSYTNHLYSPEQVISRGKGNCVDNSRVFRLFMLSLGIKCNFVHGFSCCSGGECANHQWNKVYIDGKGVTIDVGRSNASWGSHWGRCSGGESETSNSW